MILTSFRPSDSLFRVAFGIAAFVMLSAQAPSRTSSDSATAPAVKEVEIPSLDKPAPDFRPAPEKGPVAPNPDRKRIITMIGPEGGFEDALLAGGLRDYPPGCRNTLSAHCGVPLPSNIEDVCGPIQRNVVAVVDRSRPFPGSICFGVRRAEAKRPPLPERKPLPMPDFSYRGDAKIVAGARPDGQQALVPDSKPATSLPEAPESPIVQRAAETPSAALAARKPTEPLRVRAPAEMASLPNVGRLKENGGADAGDAPPTPGTKPIFGAHGWKELKKIPKPPARAVKPIEASEPATKPKPRPIQVARRNPVADRGTATAARNQIPTTVTFGKGEPVIVLIADGRRRFTGTWFAYAGDNTVISKPCRKVLSAAKGSRIPSSIDLICGTTRIYGFGTVKP